MKVKGCRLMVQGGGLRVEGICIRVQGGGWVEGSALKSSMLRAYGLRVEG